MNVKNFGRIAAQTAKQVLIQRIRELEKEKQFEKYSELKGTVTTAEVIRVTGEWADIRIGKLETRLPKKEWIPDEEIEAGDLVKVYIIDVVKTTKGPKILVSRRVPEFVIGLMKLEIPEVENGIVEIKAIAREPGVRTKVAVSSNDPNVDPIGACIGEGGSRIAAILKEPGGREARCSEVVGRSQAAHSERSRTGYRHRSGNTRQREQSSRVIVPPTQLSLAIGKGGQNARLAAKLTGWKIDIKPIMNL